MKNRYAKSLFIFIVLFNGQLWAQSYLPPIGIPAPEFGINETVENTYGSDTYFTHYIDNTHIDARDNANPNGSLAIPRLTIPGTLPAGSVVEVRGGPYNEALRIRNSQGTESEPIFIRGRNSPQRPILRGLQNAVTIVDSSYVIFENFHLDGSTFTTHNRSMALQIMENTSFISIRNNEISNYPMTPFNPDTGRAAYFLSITAISVSSQYQTGEMIEDIVMYDNTIQQNGDFPATYESGRHAVIIAGATKNIWLVDNNFNNNAEDGVQVFWFTSGLRGAPAEFVYIGRNLIYNHGENAIDIKQASDVIVSENTLYGHYATDFEFSGSDGAAVVFNDDSPNTRLWLLNNTIFDNAIGIRNQSGGENYIVGNLFYNLRAENGEIPSNIGRNSGVAIWSTTAASMHIVNNTIVDVVGGIYAPSGTEIHMNGNLISSLVADTTYHLGIHPSNFDVVNISNNLLWQADRPVLLFGIDNCVLCLEVDPLFINADTRKYQLQAGSPAVSNGTDGSVYQTFFDLYGINIQKDIDGNPRPGNTTWDIGAYELPDGFMFSNGFE